MSTANLTITSPDDDNQLVANYIINNFIPAVLAGLLIDLTLFPLDTIKTRFQSKQGFRASGGFTGVYSGFCFNALGNIPYNVFYWSVYEIFGVVLEFPVWLASAISDTLSVLVKAPVENIKQNKQMDSLDQSSISDIILKIFLERGGVKGFYEGSFSLIAREMPFMVIQHSIYVSSRGYLTDNYGDKEFFKFLCGSIAGCAAAIATTPFDAIKTRQMLSDISDVNVDQDEIEQKTRSNYVSESVDVTLTNKQNVASASTSSSADEEAEKIKLNIETTETTTVSENHDNSFISVTKNMIQNEGWTSLFSGVVARAIYMSIGGAFFFGGYDYIGTTLWAQYLEFSN